MFVSITSVGYKINSSIKCPVCEGKEIHIEEITKILKKEDMEMLQDNLIKTYVRQTKDIIRCPLSTCSYAGM